MEAWSAQQIWEACLCITEAHGVQGPPPTAVSHLGRKRRHKLNLKEGGKIHHSSHVRVVRAVRRTLCHEFSSLGRKEETPPISRLGRKWYYKLNFVGREGKIHHLFTSGPQMALQTQLREKGKEDTPSFHVWAANGVTDSIF